MFVGSSIRAHNFCCSVIGVVVYEDDLPVVRSQMPLQFVICLAENWHN